MASQSDDSALDAGNEVFHETYDGARNRVRHQVPILVVFPTDLILHSHDGRRAVGYCQPSFTRAKSAAHIAVALFALTGEEANPAEFRASLDGLIRHISAALAAASTSDCRLSEEVHALLERCLQYASSARVSPPGEGTRAEFASDAGPRVLSITERATCEQIAGLHAAVEELFSKLSAREQGELQVVVVGDHQARVRSLGMQYFKRRLHEGEADQRVTYGENVGDEQEAISLVATRLLDQRIALAFFGDEHRLQRDVLGDAAKHCLDRMTFRD